VTKVSRRSRVPLVGAFVLIAALLIAACGGGGGIEGGSDNADVQTAPNDPPASGSFTISNWPFYIDNQTVADFEKKTGVSVKYIEDVNDNSEFFAKMQPLLSDGQSGNRSMMVVTDWMAKKMYDLGYLQNMDQDAIAPAKANMRTDPGLQHPDFDPDRAFSMPWQSGMTGLVVNTKLAPDVKSINDLFDPQYKGKVEMLTELRDTVPLVMKADGVDPADATTQDWLDAIDKIKEAAASGQIRRFTGNDYTRDMASGDAVAVIGWSGDAVQLQADNPDIQFVMPTEGCMLWSDNMVIPVGAPNPTAAYAWINYVYEPKNQAQITAYNNYVQPVEGVQQIFEKTDPPLAKNPLIFPDEQFTANCSTQVSPPAADEQEVEQAFQSVITG
jgi:spermidine/putrescine transport system substrate-binding protein